MKVVVASNNPDKLKELSALSSREQWLKLVMPPDGFDVVENGSTFFENAKVKAAVAAKLANTLAVADDSGLVVEALNGRPGIHSSRYCEGDDAARRQKLLQELNGFPDGQRQAAFMCAMVVCEPDSSIAFSVVRAWEGIIAHNERGENGFGYDSIFYLPKFKCTSAELTPEQKNELSHRGQAWREVLKYLKAREEGQLLDFSP
jgi:non-canonical purine NTP pyrophosphatase (RdgB/HAM1 family)